jgi:hypothetical protein
MNRPSGPPSSPSTRRPQCKALNRTQPSLPMKKARAGTTTHEYKRNGTTAAHSNTRFPVPLSVMMRQIKIECEVFNL